MNDPRGSVWRKWDLQVHTPCSLVHGYAGTTTDERWDLFLRDLENLPEEVQVLCVSDYLFLDGYKKLVAAKRNGRLPKIKLLLPALELRLDKFGGSGSKLSRVNYHAIFSPVVSPEIIEAQFIAGLTPSYQLSPTYAKPSIKWEGVVTVASLTQLGKQIGETLPPEKRDQFGPPLIEGFNALNVSLSKVVELLERPYFKNQSITAVGKTEWWDVKWNDTTIAEKKNIINGADLVLISAETLEAFNKAKQSLVKAGVNSRLVDCSDAHCNADSKTKDRIGKCFTWIKADPTFEGLRLALQEFEGRVFVGDTPPILERVSRNRTKYIKSLRIAKAAQSELQESWFDCSIEFNPGLVAVFGNKGSGKSALSDTIGLIGNSPRSADFSFLNEQKFKHPQDNKAVHFEAILHWESGASDSRNLNDPVDAAAVETVKYIPQNYLEKICNELKKTTEGEFDRELKAVVFSHVDDSKRLGCESLDALIEHWTQETYGSISLLREELHKVNAQVVSIQRRQADSHVNTIKNRIAQKKRELKAHDEVQPQTVRPPEESPTAQNEMARIAASIEEKLRLLKEHEEKAATLQDNLRASRRRASAAEKVLAKADNFSRQYEVLRGECESHLTLLGLKFEDLVQVEVKRDRLIKIKDAAENEAATLAAELSREEASGALRATGGIRDEILELERKLDEPNRQYRAFLRMLSEWEQARRQIVGDEDQPDSLTYLESELAAIETLPSELRKAEAQQTQVVRRIYGEIQKLCTVYIELHRPVQDFIAKHPLAKEPLNLRFSVYLDASSFRERFFDYVHHGARGSFCGVAEGTEVARKLLERADFSSEGGVLQFVQSLQRHLSADMRGGEEVPIEVATQLKKGVTEIDLYDFMYSLEYLQPRYKLQWGDRDLDQLSPGERGILLLVFYMLIDRSDVPLVVDQPEGNLDNQTVYSTLVTCIREAKQSRQIIIVTHNPNLAVVCDAEQLIRARLDRDAGNRVTYETGAIENPRMNPQAVDVLEGTRPAFDNREAKYRIVREEA